MKKGYILIGILITVIFTMCVACAGVVRAGNQSNTEVTIKTEAANLDVTVPTTLPIIFKGDGTNTLPRNFKIENNSEIADIYLKEVTMTAAQGAWKLLAKSEDAKTLLPNTKAIKFLLGEQGKEKIVSPMSGTIAQEGQCDFAQTDFVVASTSEKRLNFIVERANFTKEIPAAKAFDMTLDFSFVDMEKQEKQLLAGLYDAQGALLYSWDELVEEYGLNVEQSYNEARAKGSAAYVLNRFEDAYKLVVDGSVNEIGKYALAETYLTEIVLPSSVNSMGMYTFFNSPNLKEVALSSTLKKIPIYAFGSCIALEKLDLPEGLESIEPYAFRSCRALKTITIPETVVTIDLSGDNYATTFMDCASLTTIFYSGGALGAPWGATNAITVAK